MICLYFKYNKHKETLIICISVFSWSVLPVVLFIFSLKDLLFKFYFTSTIFSFFFQCVWWTFPNFLEWKRLYKLIYLFKAKISFEALPLVHPASFVFFSQKHLKLPILIYYFPHELLSNLIFFSEYVGTFWRIVCNFLFVLS